MFPKKQEQARKTLFFEFDNLKPNFPNRLFIEKSIPDLAEKRGSFFKMFDGDNTNIVNPTYQNLVNYIKGNKIVEDLMEHIQYFNNSKHKIYY